MTETDKISWNCEMEVNLFHALRGHKPVVLNSQASDIPLQYFTVSFNLSHTTLIKLNAYCKGKGSKTEHMNESEIVPFPNKQADFLLPDPDFSDVMQKGFPRFLTPKSDETKSEKDKSEKQLDKIDKSDKAETVVSKSKSDGRLSISAIATPDNSPKRKRTRNTPTTASPATPDAPPTKRRR